MALARSYDANFLRIWEAYPKKPTGRSRKELAFKAYTAANRLLRFSPSDIDAIVKDIQDRIKTDLSWLSEHGKYIPGCQVYLSQHRWNEPYNKARIDYNRPIETKQSIATDTKYAAAVLAKLFAVPK